MIIKRCATKGAYEVLPENNTKMDLKKIKNKYPVTTELPMLIMLKIKDHEVTCYKNGKLMIRDCKTEEEAQEIASEIYNIK